MGGGFDTAKSGYDGAKKAMNSDLPWDQRLEGIYDAARAGIKAGGNLPGIAGQAFKTGDKIIDGVEKVDQMVSKGSEAMGGSGAGLYDRAGKAMWRNDNPFKAKELDEMNKPRDGAPAGPATWKGKDVTPEELAQLKAKAAEKNGDAKPADAAPADAAPGPSAGAAPAADGPAADAPVTEPPAADAPAEQKEPEQQGIQGT
jgi:hypothetical protein